MVVARHFSIWLSWCLVSGERGGTSLGLGVLTVVLYRRLGATSQQRRGTWFPLVGAGGFRGAGSRFCHVGIHLCLFWGVRHRLGGQVHLWAVGGFRRPWVSHPVVSLSLVVVAVWCLCRFCCGLDHVVSSSVGGLG